MTVRRDHDRLIRAFLDEGPVELPDRTFDEVRANIDQTRQRTVFGPGRSLAMPSILRYLAIAAALAVVVVGGGILANGPFAGGSPSPGTTATQGPPPSSSPSTALSYRWPGALAAGRYSTSFAWNIPFALGFTVPAGWQARDVEIIKGDMSIALQLESGLVEDPCAATPASVDAGATPDEFARALATIAAVDATSATATTLAGMPAVGVTYSARAGVQCVGEDSRLWSSPEWMLLPVEPLGPPSWPLRAGLHRLWIIDVAGTRVLIDATAGANPTPEKEAELQRVLDSLAFVEPTEARDLGSCTMTLSSPPDGAAVVPPGPVAMSATHYPILAGALPESFVEPAVSAHVDFRVADISGSGPESMRPTTGVVPPPGSGKSGVATLLGESIVVSGSRDLVGTLLLDAPGTWWVRISVPYAGCVYQQPLQVTPPG